MNSAYDLPYRGWNDTASARARGGIGCGIPAPFTGPPARLRFAVLNPQPRWRSHLHDPGSLMLMRSMLTTGTLVALVAGAVTINGSDDHSRAASPAQPARLPVDSALISNVQAITAAGRAYVAVDGKPRRGVGDLAPLGDRFARVFQVGPAGVLDELPQPPVAVDGGLRLTGLAGAPCVGFQSASAPYVACFEDGTWRERRFTGSARTQTLQDLRSSSGRLYAELVDLEARTVQVVGQLAGRWQRQGPAIPASGTGAVAQLGEQHGGAQGGPLVSFSTRLGRGVFVRRRVARAVGNRLSDTVPPLTVRGGGPAGPVVIGGRTFVAQDSTRGVAGVHTWANRKYRFVRLPRLGSGFRQTWLSYVDGELYATWQVVRDQRTNAPVGHVEAYAARLDARTGKPREVFRLMSAESFAIAGPTVFSVDGTAYGVVIRSTKPERNETIVELRPLRDLDRVPLK